LPINAKSIQLRALPMFLAGLLFISPLPFEAKYCNDLGAWHIGQSLLIWPAYNANYGLDGGH